MCCCCFEGYGDTRDLHVLTPSFPTRRSSDLPAAFRGAIAKKASGAQALPMRLACRLQLIPLANPAQIQCHHAYSEWKSMEHVRSEEHTSELQSLMRISYAVFCLKKKKKIIQRH